MSLGPGVSKSSYVWVSVLAKVGAETKGPVTGESQFGKESRQKSFLEGRKIGLNVFIYFSATSDQAFWRAKNPQVGFFPRGSHHAGGLLI